MPDHGEDAAVSDVLEAFALLADERRLAVVAALVLGAGTSEEVGDRTGLPRRRVLEALSRLEAGGLVARGEGARWTFDVGRLKELAGQARPHEDAGDLGDVDGRSATILRTFLRAGRLTHIPTTRSKRLVVLDHICRVFDVGARYPEREVDAMLRAFHPDHAALRRYLVDEGFLAREAGTYWRTGGTVDVEGTVTLSSG